MMMKDQIVQMMHVAGLGIVVPRHVYEVSETGCKDLKLSCLRSKCSLESLEGLELCHR